jgi:hypothetical protein
MTLRVKLFVGGSPDDLIGQYRTWGAAQPVTIVDRPKIESAGRGWTITVFYQASGPEGRAHRET